MNSSPSSSPIPPSIPSPLTSGSDPLNASGGNTSSQNFLIIVLFALLSTITTTQSLSQTNANTVETNAALQESLNKQIGQLQFQQPPNKGGTNTVNQVNAYNQNVEFLRQGLQGNLVGARQIGQGAIATANVLTDYLQNTSSGVTAVLSLMTTILQMINRINQP